MSVIIYIDMNSFFVSCHEIEKPWLRNKPVVVSGTSRRAVVASASYEARKYHIKSGMPLFKAKALCPKLIQIPVNHKLYSEYSNKIFKFLAANFTPLIEHCSIDEFCLDASDIDGIYDNLHKCADTIQQQLLATFQLPCSIGISFDRTLAKIASKLKKPQGIESIMEDEIQKKLHPLAINQMVGIGPKSTARLQAINIYTIGDLALTTNYEALQAILGKRYLLLVAQAQGKTHETVNLNTTNQRKSIGRDVTLEYDTNNKRFVYGLLKHLAQDIALKAQKNSFVGQTIVCGFKIEKSRWRTKQCQVLLATNDAKIIFETAVSLLDKVWNHKQQLRSLRIALKNK